MFDERQGTLLATAPTFPRAARGGKGFLGSRLALSGPGGGVGVGVNQTQVTVSS